MEPASIVRLTAVLSLLSAIAAPAGAQWVSYPTAGVPRTATGAPDLNAPTPRTTDGKPDFSGIWQPEKNRPCPPEGCDDMPIPQEFLNIGWSLKGGLPYQPWAAELVKARKALNGQEDPGTHCLPTGIIMMHTTPLLKKIVQTPGLLVILNERNATYRQIFLDGRPLPADPQPSWVGYSTAKWDGDTLVVETSGFRDGIWLDRGGSPLTEAGRITERFRRVTYGRLEIRITVDDPKAYTAPWTVQLNQFLVLNTDLLDYICLENEKDAPHFSR
jgi:hypothetical protein